MEPLLQRISAIIPDDKIDQELFFPHPKRGPRHHLKPSQMYRIHLLLCLKRVASFRQLQQLQQDLSHHREWRAFAHLKNKNQVPSLDALSRFRQQAPILLRQINFLYLKMIFSIILMPLVIVAVPDSTDIRAATKGYPKKTARVWPPVTIYAFILPKKPPRDIAPRSRDSPSGSSDTRNTPCGFSSSTSLPSGLFPL